MTYSCHIIMFLLKGAFQLRPISRYYIYIYSTDLFLLRFEHLPVIVTTSRCQHQTMSAKHKPSAANAAPSQSSSKSLSLGAPPRGRGGGAEVTMGGGKLSSSVTAYEGSSKCQKPALLHVLRQRHMQRHITTRGTANCVSRV